MKQITIRSILIFVLILLSMTIANANNGNISTTYLTYVDDGLGFYKIRNLDIPPRQFEYNDHTLNINQGDTVIWQNDADKATFTIVSNQNLWSNEIGYLRLGSKINYRFDKPGKYDIYIKEYTSRRQTIIVSAIGGVETVTETPIPTATPVPTTYIATPIPTTAIPTPIVTAYIPANAPTSRDSIVPRQTPIINLPTINLHISGTMMASIIVAIFSIFITIRVGRNKS